MAEITGKQLSRYLHASTAKLFYAQFDVRGELADWLDRDSRRDSFVSDLWNELPQADWVVALALWARTPDKLLALAGAELGLRVEPKIPWRQFYLDQWLQKQIRWSCSRETAEQWRYKSKAIRESVNTFVATPAYDEYVIDPRNLPAGRALQSVESILDLEWRDRLFNQLMGASMDMSSDLVERSRQARRIYADQAALVLPHLRWRSDESAAWVAIDAALEAGLQVHGRSAKRSLIRGATLLIEGEADAALQTHLRQAGFAPCSLGWAWAPGIGERLTKLVLRRK